MLPWSLISVALAHPCDVPEARQFDFWLGAWDIDNRQRNPAAPDDATLHPTGPARSVVYPVAGGCAVAEHWDGALSWARVHGFSLRTWDAAADRWEVLFNWPVGPGGPPNPAFTELSGVRDGQRMVLDGPPSGARRSRFTFSDVGPDRFRWDATTSTDGGVRWSTDWVMDFERRRVPPPGIGVAPLGAEPLCAGAEHRSLDGLVGSWRGRHGDDPVSLDVVPILGGCGQIDQLTVGVLEVYRVRAFDPKLGRWVQYRVDSRGPGLTRAVGRWRKQALELEAERTALADDGLDLELDGVEGTVHLVRR
jgi:hypothetical protein